MMMYHFLMTAVASAAILLVGCSGSKPTTSNPNEIMERGWIERGALMKPEYPQFKQNFDSAKVDANFVDMIKMLHSDIEFVVVLATWCSDSRRNVPRFLKIADLTGIPPSHIRYYAVDRTKRSSDGVTDMFRIELVPTFILLKNREEIGRIVESPKTSMEEDMLVILADAQNK